MREWHLLVETTRSLVVLLFVIDPISILAHPHCTTVGKLLKSLVVIHSQRTLLKAARSVFQPYYEHLRLVKRITTMTSLHMVLFIIDWWFNENLCIIFLVMNISTYITDWVHLIWLKSIFYYWKITEYFKFLSSFSPIFPVDFYFGGFTSPSLLDIKYGLSLHI